VARNVTVQKVVDQVQILVQDPDHALATEAQYISIVDEEHARLYSYYVAAEPDRYRTEATINGVTGTSAYALPSDWLATIAVDFVSGSVREPLHRLQENDRHRYVNATGASRAYRVIGTNVVLFPTPLTGQTYTHVYIPTAPTLSAGATNIDCRLGHDKWLQLCTARTLLNSENSYDGRWDEEIAKTEAELKLEANYRYFKDMARMQSERELWRRTWPYWPFGERW
jgi:hypothetical protein